MAFCFHVQLGSVPTFRLCVGSTFGGPPLGGLPWFVGVALGDAFDIGRE